MPITICILEYFEHHKSSFKQRFPVEGVACFSVEITNFRFREYFSSLGKSPGVWRVFSVEITIFPV